MRTFLAALLVALPAAAADITVIHAGRLLDGNDAPVNAATPLAMQFALYASPVPLPEEQPTWKDTYDVSVTNGTYSVELGKGGSAGQKLTTTHFAPGSTRYLQVTVAGQVLLPRLKIGLAPLAGTALDLACPGCVTTDKLADAAISGAKLAPASVSGSHFAPDAFGTSATTAARGDHTHDGRYLPLGSTVACPGGTQATGIDPATGNVTCASDSILSPQDVLAALGAKSNANPMNHDRYTDAEAVAAMGAKANTNPLNHDRYTNAEAVAAMGAKANTNPLNHDRYTDQEAVAAMGAKSNTNPLNHDRFTNSEAVAAMGAKANSNPLNHDRYTDQEAAFAAGGDLIRMVNMDDMTAWPDPAETVFDVLPDGREALAHKSVEAGVACYNWALTNRVPVNPNRAYRASIWVRATETDTANYFGFFAYDASGNQIGGAWGNPYFKTNRGDANAYREWSGYMLPTGVTDANADGVADRQSAATNGTDWRFPPNTASIALRWGACYGNGSNTGLTFYALPAFREVAGPAGTDSQWVDAAFQNGWTNYGNGYNPAGYFIDHENIVHLRGLVRGGSGTIFTLPAEARPPYRELRAVNSVDTIARVDVTTDGQVLWSSGGNNTWISLDGITFRAGY